jgi:ankyrin repeat protein
VQISDIKELLVNGADANTSDSSGFTLLMSFAKKNDIESMGLLLEYAANINAKDILNFTALDYAVKEHNLKAVKFLVENGAFVSEDTYMFALNTQNKDIVAYFDSLDPNKHVFLKKVKRYH